MAKSSRWTWVSFIAVAIFLLWLLVSVAAPQGPGEEMRLDEFIAAARDGAIAGVVQDGDELRVTRRGDDVTYIVGIGSETSLLEILREENIDRTSMEIEIRSQGGSAWLGVLLSFLPLLLIGGLIVFFLRSRGAGGVAATQMTKSGARLAATRPDVRFDDVAGQDEAKEELQEVIEFLREPERYRALGAQVPKGVLLMGAPGTGKTYMARAVAGEAAVPFFSISGSQFVEMYVGVGAARVRDLFKEAKANAPCIVFIDELDAVGRQRGAGLGGGHDEREQTLNQILVELDGFEPETNVIVLAATNRPDILDAALIRPGRFDRRIVLDRPDVRGRLAILHVHARNKKLGTDVSLEGLAKQTAGFVGADLANLLNEAALLAARYGQSSITQANVDEAVDRVIAGPQRKGRLLSLAEKRRVAVHEAGHALVAHRLPLADTVTKISIVPRGVAGGYTRFAPESDSSLRTREELRQHLTAFLGGRQAEALVLGDVSTGAEDDIERATALARRMVTRWGMSEDLGPRTLGRREEQVFLGRDLGSQRDFSEHVAEEIDEEIRRFVEQAADAATEILKTNRDAHQRLIELLLDEETLTGPVLLDALGGPRAGAPPAEEPAVAEEFQEPPAPRWSVN